jgi:hypothetical protein
MPAASGIEYVLDKLRWMRAQHIWPNGLRYLWTDAFGVVLLVSLYSALAKDEFLDEAERVVAEVDRVLGRPRGIRIGEEPDRDGQYFTLSCHVALRACRDWAAYPTIPRERHRTRA